MFDIETLDTIPSSVVLSLGAVLFTKNEIVAKKVCYFNIDSQTEKKRTISQSTLLWWLSQAKEARHVFDKLSKNNLDTLYSLIELNEWLKQNSNGEHLVPYGNGAAFDIPIIESLFNDFGITFPWKFWDVRCYRTIKYMFNIEQDVVRDGVKHDALDDAVFQATCMQRFIKSLEG